MSRRRPTRRRVLQTAALLPAALGVLGCGRGKRDASRNPSSVSGWDVVQSRLQGPGLRSRHCFAYDSAAKVCVLFGGISWADGGVPYSDCWELRGRQWSPVGGSNSPVGRQRGAMVYDSKRTHCVLFGGQGKRKNDWPILGDTWFYAGRTWQQWDAGSGKQPEPRAGHSLAFDEETGTVVLFGGIDESGRSLGDTWLFDGGSWQPVSGPGPAARRYAAFAFDSDLKGCVLNGGSEDDAGQHGFGDTWQFRNGTWTRLSKELDTITHDDHSLAYHRTAKRQVMFGGLNGNHSVLLREANGWRTVGAQPLPPRFQCSPLAWDDGLDGLVYYGGEANHGGPQFQKTWVLRMAAGADSIQGTFESL